MLLEAATSEAAGWVEAAAPTCAELADLEDAAEDRRDQLDEAMFEITKLRNRSRKDPKRVAQLEQNVPNLKRLVYVYPPEYPPGH